MDSSDHDTMDEEEDVVSTGTSPPPPETQKPEMLVKEPSHLIAAMDRLRRDNTGIVFRNCDDTFKILLRNDPDADAGMVAGDICIVHGEDDPRDEIVRRVIDLDPDGYEDEHGTFVMESFCFPRTDLEAATETALRLNLLFASPMCRCQMYLIKDRRPMCVFCTLTSTSEDLKPHFCCVCQDASPQMHMRLQSCCSQYVHPSCLTKWHTTSGKTQCPMCRTDV